jgi:LysM repeat protein
MNTPNPLIPQGTFPESRDRSHIRIAVFTILAIHVVLLGALLLQGCKRTTETPSELTNIYTPPIIEPTVAQPTTTTSTPGVTPTPVTPPVAPEPIPLAPPTEPPSAGVEHVVVKGDSFYVLAKKYGVTMKAIAEANPGVDSTRLKIGQKLHIPPPGPATSSATASNGDTTPTGEKVYVVKSGDTLMKIAKMHGTTVRALRAENNLRTDQIKVGQKLKIPAKTTPPVETTPAPATPETPAPGLP